MLIAIALLLVACKSSHPDASEDAAANPYATTAMAPIEQGPGGSASSSDQAVHREATMGSVNKPTPARPLSSSLSELGQGAPLPDLEGEPTIAVFVERISGGLMPNIEHATSRLRAGMRACYLRSVSDEPPDASRLALRIVVSTNGSVTSVRPESATDIDNSAVDCMVRRAQTATFPAPVGEPAEIVLSIAFLPPRLHER